MRVTTLPIDALLPDLRAALREYASLVIEAPPGAGKTTRVPLALLDEPWLAGRRILMLEPRRLAARAAAEYMAEQRAEAVGNVVGYRTRFDTRVGSRTRLEVVTEGVLTRLLQRDPGLDGVGAVIFDEFHERSLHADLGLALCLHARRLLRPDLRILVMSATLDGLAVSALLSNSMSGAGDNAVPAAVSTEAPVLRSHGRSWPVTTHWLPRARTARIEEAAANAVFRALPESTGDLLVFLPGAGEIRRTAERLAPLLQPGTRVLPLYGDLPREEQRRALAPGVSGERRIVLATSIAETSLTIEGVRVVIDGGLMRVPRFSARTGMTRLDTMRVTRDAADQRRGRAGRTAPGTCYRLWSEGDEAGLVAHCSPEILEADLATLALELAAWGVTDPAELDWLDPPPAAAFAQARELLRELEALDAHDQLTAHGRVLARLPAHPRLAHMIVRALPLGLAGMACELAALLGERDILRSAQGEPDPDVRLRLDALRAARLRERGASHAPAGATVDHGGVTRVLAEARQLWQRVQRALPDADARSDSNDSAAHAASGAAEARANADTGVQAEWAGRLLAFAYPDRIAQRRRKERGRFRLRSGQGAQMTVASALADAPFLVAAELGGHGRDNTIFLAAPLDAADLQQDFAGQIAVEETVTWHARSGRVRARRRQRLGALVLADAPLTRPDPGEVAHALLDGVRAAGSAILPFGEAARSLRTRVAFLRTLDGDWPDLSDDALLATLDDWLGPFAAGRRSLDELRRVDLAAALALRLSPKQRALLDTLAPTHLTVPSGSRIAIDYSDAPAPVLAVRLQEVFGWTETPRLAEGRVPLTLRLLSPAQRPVQVTRDLASFWRTGYFEVRKDLRGRYPRHFWPDDPLTAPATRRTRPRP